MDNKYNTQSDFSDFTYFSPAEREILEDNTCFSPAEREILEDNTYFSPAEREFLEDTENETDDSDILSSLTDSTESVSDSVFDTDIIPNSMDINNMYVVLKTEYNKENIPRATNITTIGSKTVNNNNTTEQVSNLVGYRTALMGQISWTKGTKK